MIWDIILGIGFIIAGGLKALSSTVENAEDDIVDGVSQSKKIDINSQDVVIALTASSKTPFTIEVLKYANHKKALTIGISNNKGDIQKIAKQNITNKHTAPNIAFHTACLHPGTNFRRCPAYPDLARPSPT